jgi:dTDP-4-amino-4,6-dideoxygalactose transaminase
MPKQSTLRALGGRTPEARSVVKKPLAFAEPIYVSRPLLPDLDQFRTHLDEIWHSRWLSNCGAKHKALEEALREHLNAQHISLFNNGTIALIIACQALRLSGEVITTPFTFPATPHVLSWNNITPVFADIHPERLTLDPKNIEPLITSRTTGVLAVHVYGMPCAVEEIRSIGEAYGLKVIYDGAHAFGTTIDNRPITDFGDATMLSFHATKLFHTAEGGALVVRDPALRQRIELLKNFGIKNEFEVVMPGINGKMNEVQAALGILTLGLVESERRARDLVASVYRERLSGIPGLVTFDLPPNVRSSQQYFIIRIDSSISATSRDVLYERLKEFNIYSRKYFYPLCSQFNCYRSLPSAAPANLPVAYRVAEEVLALPFFGALNAEGAHRISDVIKYVLGGH